MTDTRTLSLPPAARAGDPAEAIDTPALVLDLDAFERNLDRMQARVSGAGLKLRPHAKAHKCPAIALAQVARGAAGICCQKASEALPFLQAGVRDIHVSNEVVGEAKAALLARLALHGTLSACVDDAGQVAVLARAAAQAGSRLALFVELDIGHHRCGVPDAPSALRLVEAIAAHPQLRFGGVQAYQGGIQHLRSRAERGAAVAEATARLRDLLDALARAGVHCPEVTGGGTGTLGFDLASGVYSELQPGSYVGMDADYGRNEFEDGLRFEQALFVLASVMSRTSARQVVVDAGLKSLAVDSGLPLVWAMGREGRPDPALRYVAANDEHGIVHVEAGDAPALGSRLWLVPGHIDPTMNLHDGLVAVRGGRVEALWPVAARGLSR